MPKPRHIKIYENQIFKNDIEAINELIKQLSENAKPVDWKKVKSVLKNATVFILRDQSPKAKKQNPRGIIIGKIILLHSHKMTAFFGTIQDVVVHENYRGKGLGKLLTKEAIKKGKKLGMKYIDLSSRPDREAANKLYESVGFKKRDSNPYRLRF